jgi:hypothetical protein
VIRPQRKRLRARFCRGENGKCGWRRKPGAHAQLKRKTPLRSDGFVIGGEAGQ